MKTFLELLLVKNALATAVCLQAAFLTPYVVLVPGERTNVFTSVLVLLPLLQVGWTRLTAGGAEPMPWRTCVPWLVLAVGLGAVSLASPEPYNAALRALSFIAPAVAGLACGLELFRTPGSRQYLFRLLTFCFTGLAGTHLIFGAMPSFMGLHHHALAGTLVLLSAGPIHMVGGQSRLQRAAGFALILLGAVVCFQAGSRFVILLPFALIPVYVAFKSVTVRRAAMGLAASAVVAGVFFAVFPSKVPRAVNYESTFYRVEAFPATWEIVKHHGLLGIGIRTPRRAFLQAFEPVFGMVDRESFLMVVDRNVTWDNQYLSLLCGVGVPLTLLYLFLAGRLLATYLRRAWRQEIDHATERAVTFALLASVIHFTVHDGLFYPQIGWFFHLLLGAGVSYLSVEVAERTVDARVAAPARGSGDTLRDVAG